jgi:ankyrin repeat protein
MVLHEACWGGYYLVVEWLLKVGANANARDIHGMTPLHWAAHYSHSLCVQLLLAAGADPSIADNDMNIPLHYARCSPECAALLISAYPAGVNVVGQYKRTALHVAAHNGTLDVCLMLLAAGSVIDAMEHSGCTPLYFALFRGKRDIAEMLLDHGAQLDIIYPESIPEWATFFVECRKACRSSSYAILELARRGSPLIGGNRRDALGLVARSVWANRRDECWEESMTKKEKL